MDKDVVLFCAGWKNRVNVEDSLYAGAVAQRLKSEEVDDATLLCIDAYDASKDNLFAALKKSNHFQRLASKGVTKDIAYCCETDIINSVGVLSTDRIILA